MSVRKLTQIGLLIACAIILHIAEGLIPLALPMCIKLGFANIITLIALMLLDFKSTLIIVAMRCFMGSLFSGTFLSVTFLMSFGGGMMAAICMYAVLRFVKALSPVGISICGALAHNLTQLAVASLVIGNAAIYYYLPIMLIASIPTGILVGLITGFITPRLRVLVK